MSIKIGLTKNIKSPNKYIQALSKDYKDWIFNEEQAPLYKGKWSLVFSQKAKQKNLKIDLEIGIGTGIHFSQLCLKNPDRCFIGIELKYKPLIQSIRRARKNKLKNMKGLRYNAKAIEDLFEKEEIDNVYLHFPDPWLKKKSQKKHQLIQADFCKKLYDIQKNSSFLEFKTDSLKYFKASLKYFKQAGYKVETINKDLYLNKNLALTHEMSQFELIFFKKQEPIKYALLTKA